MLFNELLQTFTKSYLSYKDLLHQHNSTYRVLIKKSMSSPCFFDDIIKKKAKNFTTDTHVNVSLTTLFKKKLKIVLLTHV
jgi:hypothetical protein